MVNSAFTILNVIAALPLKILFTLSLAKITNEDSPC